MPYHEVTRKDQLKVIGYLVLMITFNVLTAYILIPAAWPWGLIAWLVLCFGGSLYLLVRWHALNTAYRCPACKGTFEISIFSDFSSPHVPNKKYLKCPHCNERNWANILMKMD
jgi:DNA-directed RNA polymerase subunit RPC12/RpoP